MHTWEIAVVLSIVLAASSTALVVLWPWSKRWAHQNRLHASATRSERVIRAESVRLLDRALRELVVMRRSCAKSVGKTSLRELNNLIDEIQLVRDQVKSDYLPSPTSLHLGRDIGIEWLTACEQLEELCEALAIADGLDQDPAVEGVRDVQLALTAVRRFVLEPL